MDAIDAEEHKVMKLKPRIKGIFIFCMGELFSPVTQIFYSILFIVGTCHAHSVVKPPTMWAFCLVMVILSATCVVCSLVMLIGLWKDNRLLLLPWTVAVSMTTLIDVMLSFYLIKDAITDPFLAVLFVTDVLICALNVYALLCVLSQYQEYKTGMTGDHFMQPRHQAASKQPPPKPPHTSSVTDDVTSSNAFLLPPSPMKSASGGKHVYCELTTISEEKTPVDGTRATTPIVVPPSSAPQLQQSAVTLDPASFPEVTSLQVHMSEPLRPASTTESINPSS